MINDVKRRITCHIKPSILMKIQALRKANKALTSRNVVFERAVDFYYHYMKYLYDYYSDNSKVYEEKEYLNKEVFEWFDIFKGKL